MGFWRVIGSLVGACDEYSKEERREAQKDRAAKLTRHERPMRANVRELVKSFKARDIPAKWCLMHDYYFVDGSEFKDRNSKDAGAFKCDRCDKIIVRRISYGQHY